MLIIQLCLKQNIYIARNPKDTILSFYFFYRLMKVLDFQGDIELFAQYFMQDKRIILHLIIF